MQGRVENRDILIVEDDLSIARELVEYFGGSNRVVHADTLKGAEKALCQNKFDGIILDVLLPDGEGTDLFNTNKLLPPTVILSTLDSEQDMLSGLLLGAADYVSKPCSPRLLEARLALRLLPKEEAYISIHGVTAEINGRTVTFNEAHLPITGCEFNILWFLMQHAGSFYMPMAIYENVWEAPSLKQTSVKYHISNLRHKLKAATGLDLIITEFGKGYSFLAKAGK